jgi:hypothetical protein
MLDASKAKTTEEYLIELEKKFLASFDNTHKALDAQLVLVYGLCLVLMLAYYSEITTLDFTLLFIKISLYKTHVLISVTAIAMVLYIVIIHNISVITTLYSRLAKNSEELLSLNAHARPMSSADLRLMSSGGLSVLLSMPRRSERADMLFTAWDSFLDWLDRRLGRALSKTNVRVSLYKLVALFFILPFTLVISILSLMLLPIPLFVSATLLFDASSTVGDLDTRILLISAGVLCFALAVICLGVFADLHAVAVPEFGQQGKE